MAQKRLSNPVLFICDIQEKFRKAIWEFPKMVATAKKMIKASEHLGIPIYITTQNRKALGETVSELELTGSYAADIDKTLFSMCTPELLEKLPANAEVVIVGIESHICVTQTALDLLKRGHKVFVLADGVSSCNPEEIPIALRRLAREGAVVTSSESVIYEIVGDASMADFKKIIGLVKETKESTRDSLQTLCKI